MGVHDICELTPETVEEQLFLCVLAVLIFEKFHLPVKLELALLKLSVK